MSTTIDERVVEMRFDNRQFEAGVKTSLSTLDKLKEGLDLDGAAKGLKGLGDAAKKCDLSTLSNSVETVRMKFSALEVMAVTALSNITNSVINTGKRMIESFTLEPPKQGFDEYELNPPFGSRGSSPFLYRTVDRTALAEEKPTGHSLVHFGPGLALEHPAALERL